MQILWQVSALILSALLASCTPLRLQFPIREVDNDWNTDGRTAQRNRVSTDAPILLPIEQAWIYNAGAGFSSGSPLIVDNLVFVGTRKGELHVIELMTGHKVGTHEFGQSIEGTPALSDQTIFVPNAWGKKALIAFDLFDGQTLWEHRGVPIEASVLLVDNLVIVGDVEGNVIALDQSSGLIQWVYELGEIATIFSGPTAVGSGRTVVANELGDVACLKVIDGAEVWYRRLEPIQASIASDDQHVYLPTTRGVLHAINWQDGSTAWEYRIPNDEVKFTGAAVSETLVIFGGSDGVLRALDPVTGATQWTFQTDGTFVAAPAVSGELVFVGAMDREFFALGTHDGSLQWSTSLRGRIKSAPGVRKGVIVVMSEPRYVYGFANVDAVAEL